jgi:hypothetical protein
MNRLSFNQSVGFPLETDILHEMQESWTLFNALGALAGEFSIISGCKVIGTSIANGVVYFNGEVLAFRGGVAQENVIIVEEKNLREFEDGNSHDVIFIRYATFGVATTQWPWANFKRAFESKEIPAALFQKEDKTTTQALIQRIVALENQTNSGVPSGLIAIWGRRADEIPAGWQEYLPMRGRMPVGFDSSDPYFDVLGKYDGAKSKKLEIAEMPSHTHNLTEIKRQTGNNSNNPQSFYDQGWNMASSLKTDPTGGGQAFSIMNPYRVVLFIEKK